MRGEIERLEFHQRKYNLIFKGIKAERGQEEREIIRVCKEKLGMKNDVVIQNAHPMGKNGELVIARFMKWSDRSGILFSASKFKGTGISVQTDLPDSLRKKRSELVGKCKERRQHGEVTRVIERGMNIILQEKKDGAWVNIKC